MRKRNLKYHKRLDKHIYKESWQRGITPVAGRAAGLSTDNVSSIAAVCWFSGINL